MLHYKVQSEGIREISVAMFLQIQTDICSYNVLSCYFYDSLNLVAVPTAWILINFVTQLL